MHSIYEFEIGSYRKQIQLMRSEFDQIDWDNIENLTEYGLARSNRSNFLIVGLCGLVEAQLFEIAEKQKDFDISKVKHGGLDKLKNHLKEISELNFRDLNNWDWFKSIYEIRNTIVHSYGGMIIKKNPIELKEHLKKLNLNKYLIAERRIRFEPEGLERILKIVENLLKELEVYATQDH